MTSLPDTGLRDLLDEPTAEISSMKRTSGGSRGARNLTTMLAGRALTLIIGLASTLILARAMGVATYGKYASVLAVLAIVQLLSLAGLSTVEVRFVAPAFQRGAADQYVPLASSIFTLRVLLALFGGVLVAGWLLTSSALRLSLTLCIALGISAFLRIGFEASRSLLLPTNQVTAMVVLDLLRAAGVLAVVLTTYLRAGLPAALASLVPCFVVLWTAAHLRLRRVLPLQFRSDWLARIRPLIRFGLWSLLGNAAIMLGPPLAIWVVAQRNSVSAAGVVALPLNAYLLILGVTLTARQALLPAWSRLAEDGDDESLHRAAFRTIAHFVAVCSFATMWWALVGRTLLEVLVGAEFAQAHSVFTIILAGGTVQTICVLAVGVLYATRRPASAALAESLAPALLLACLVALTASRALSPVAVASSFAFASVAAALCALVAVAGASSVARIRFIAPLALPVVVAFAWIHLAPRPAIYLAPSLAIGCLLSAVFLAYYHFAGLVVDPRRIRRVLRGTS